MKSSLILKVHNLSFFYGKTPVLKNIRLELREGEVLGLIGASGSGKTSLLRLLGGLLSPESGHITYKGEKVKGPRESLIPGHEDIKLVSQDFDLMPYLSVQDNILRGALSESETARKRLLRHYQGRLKLREVSNNRSLETSGGQKQRAALATALAAKPEILLLDEPFSNLDYPLKKDLINILLNEWKPGGMVVVTHEPDDILTMADRLIVLEKGRLVEQGTVHEIYNHPKKEYTARLLGRVNVLTPGEARAFGIRSEKDSFLRPHHFTIGSSGMEGQVLKEHQVYNGYELEVFCPDLNKNLLVFSREKEGSKVYLSAKMPL